MKEFKGEQFQKKIQTSVKEVVVRELRTRDLIALREPWNVLRENFTKITDKEAQGQLLQNFSNVLEISTNLSAQEFYDLYFSEIAQVEALWREVNAPLLNRFGGFRKMLRTLGVEEAVLQLLGRLVKSGVGKYGDLIVQLIENPQEVKSPTQGEENPLPKEPTLVTITS